MKRPGRIARRLNGILLLVTATILCVACSRAQDLVKQMKLDSLAISSRINLRSDQAVVQVRSAIPNLRFSSNNVVGEVKEISPGVWDVFLQGGTHILKIDAIGYQQLRLEPYPFERKRSYDIVITPVGYGAPARADEDLVEVSFSVDQDSVLSGYGDFAPVLSKGRTITYKVPKGEQTFRFFRAGFVDETRKLNVTTAQQIEITLTPGRSQTGARLVLPGSLRITSTPDGAEVIVDGQVLGRTNFQSELTVGDHQLELRKPLYHSDISTFRLEEGRPITLSRVLKPRFGFLSVRSNVPNSTVYLDDKLLGPAPLTKKNIESGRHTVRVDAPMYHSQTETMEVKDGDDKSLDVVLKQAFGSLEVTSTPEEGAEVFLDNQRMGTTPYKNPQLASGRYVLKLTKALFGDAEETVIVEDARSLKRSVVLSQNFGTLKVSAGGSTIYVNGSPVGTGTYLGRLSPGLYHLAAQRSGPFRRAERDVQLGVGETREIQLEPEGQMGGLSVLVEPFEAGDAQILLNGEIKGNAPLQVKLLVGQYGVTARKDGFLDVNESVSITEGQTQSLRLQMLTFEGSREQSRARWGTVKTWTGIAGLLAGGAAVYFKVSANSNFDKYKATTRTDEALLYRDKTTQNNDLFKIAIGVGGGLLTTALVSWIVQGTK
jgi:hypothetical protein